MTFVPRSRYVAFALIAVLGAAVDLATKEWMFDLLWTVRGPDGTRKWLWEPYVAFELSLNEGALFGIGQGQVWLFASLSMVAAVGILFWLFWFGAARDWWLTIALGLVTAGIIGNLYDRLGLHGLTWPDGLAQHLGHEPGAPVYAVRDWILLTYNGHRWPNFNIADSLLVCGAAMLFVHSFRAGDSGTMGQGDVGTLGPGDKQTGGLIR